MNVLGKMGRRVAVDSSILLRTLIYFLYDLTAVQPERWRGAVDGEGQGLT